MTHPPRPHRWLLLALLGVLHVVAAWCLLSQRPPPSESGIDTQVSYVTMVQSAPPRPQKTAAPQQQPSAKPRAIASPGKVQVQPDVPAVPTQPAADEAAPPAGPAPSAEPIDKSGILSAARSPGLLTPEEKARAVRDIRSMDDNKFARAINQAARPNCVDAVKRGQGSLLALVPMIINDLRDKGCKW